MLFLDARARAGPSHVTVDDDGVVRGSYPAEDGFCDHAMLGHNWIDAFNSAEGVEGEAVADDERCPDRATELDINKIKLLSSNYLSNTLNTDSYELIRAAQHGPRTLVFIAAASSPLGSVSMPFAVRIASDATIIAALHLMGKETKDVDVFGSHLNMTSNSVIKTSTALTVRIYVTPAINVGGTHSVHQAQWDINNGKFKGTFRFIV
jgi:diaminopimelate decarboxylase